MSSLATSAIGEHTTRRARAFRVRQMMCLAVLLLGSLLTCEHVRADGHPDASVTIARTLLDFTHVATPDQQRTLERIVHDQSATRTQKAIAMALLGVFHTPAPEDLPILRSIVDDSTSPPLERVLARVIRDFMHVATAEQRAAIIEAGGFTPDASAQSGA